MAPRVGKPLARESVVEKGANQGEWELAREIAALREECQNQWHANHAEHCSNEWPHPEGYICCWPLPPSLECRR